MVKEGGPRATPRSRSTKRPRANYVRDPPPENDEELEISESGADIQLRQLDALAAGSLRAFVALLLAGLIVFVVAGALYILLTADFTPTERFRYLMITLAMLLFCLFAVVARHARVTSDRRSGVRQFLARIVKLLFGGS